MTNNERATLTEAYTKVIGKVISENMPPTEITGGAAGLATKGPDIFKKPKSTSGATKDAEAGVGDYYLKGFAKESHGDVGTKVSAALLNFLTAQPNSVFPGDREAMKAEIAKILVRIGMGKTNAGFTARVLQRVLLDNDIIKDEMGMSKTSGHRSIRVAKELNANAIDNILA
jgi:hypothetical protein